MQQDCERRMTTTTFTTIYISAQELMKNGDAKQLIYTGKLATVLQDR